MSEIEKRDFSFYSELVLVTVLSIVSAGAWTNFIEIFLNKYYPSDIKISLIIALLISLVTIIILKFFFSQRKPQSKKENN